MENTAVSLLQAHTRPTLAYKAIPETLRGRGESVGAIYLHIPFCTYKCDYCDFYSLAGHQDQFARYVACIAQQMEAESRFFGPLSPETIFIGGGTPTLLPPENLQQLMNAIRGWVGFARLVEFTVESNPNTFDAQRAHILASSGVNRISFGAQSFNPAELKMLNRDHAPENVGRAVELARAAGITNINVDLIYAIPGQSTASLENNLQKTIELGCPHISCYGLMYEPNTPMTARLRQGRLTPVAENLELEMMELVALHLRRAGFARYEISNWCQPAMECRHNLNYWMGADHLAWGASAAAHHSGTRWKCVSSMQRYCDAMEAGVGAPVTELETLAGARRWAELAVLQLRLACGIDVPTFNARTGMNLMNCLRPTLKKYDGLGVLRITDDAISLTDAGVAVSDTIFADIFAAVAAARGAAGSGG